VKRFIGLVLAITGGIATLWGGFLLLTRSTSTRIEITPEFSPTALTFGLAGVAVFTIGLVWARD
jgi:hypothetical protein